MTTLELLKLLLDSSGGQLTRVLNGIAPEKIDARLHEGGLSFGEQVAHLGEAYQAVLAAAAGEKHEWGTYSPVAKEFCPMVEEVLALREKAVAAVLVDNDELIKTGADFIVSHDLYHVGQLATMRLNVTPEWDSYSIYG